MFTLTTVKHRGNSENVDRKDFTPSEAVRAWQEIEALKGGRGKTRSESDGVSPREQSEKLTGYGHDTLSKAKQVKPVKQVNNRLDLSGISGLLKKRGNILSFFSP